MIAWLNTFMYMYRLLWFEIVKPNLEAIEVEKHPKIPWKCMSNVVCY